MKRPLLIAAAFGLATALAAGTPAQAAPGTNGPPTASIGLFHGIPDVPVDVYLGATKIADDFQPGTFKGGLSAPTGRYLVRVTAATAAGPRNPILKAHFRFVAGRSYSVIAHLAKTGAPTLTKYRNDVSSLPTNKGRLTVRHVAAAPSVDAQLNGVIVVEGLKNPMQATRVLAAKSYDAGVSLSTDPGTLVLKAAGLTIKPNTNTIVYAWGSAAKGTLALAVREVPLTPAMP